MLIEELAEPRVAIIDDVEGDTIGLQEALNKRNIKFQFIDARPEYLKHEEQFSENVRLVFLDLYYSPDISIDFNPDLCAQIIGYYIPTGHQYYLVIWSRDVDKATQVVDILEEINLSPVIAISKSKSEYFLGEKRYDIEKLFAEINVEFEEIEKHETFPGEIIEINDEYIMIDCMLDKENFQLRRFDTIPFSEFNNLKVGDFIQIKITTKPGSKNFEFYLKDDEIASAFSREDLFKDLDEGFLK